VTPSTLPPPLALLAELTHRCPLRCPYCSNPLALERASNELTTDEWRRVLDEAAALGVLQVHFSGGEPTARTDLVALVGHAATHGLYGNLITSGVLLDAPLVQGLADAGLPHVQISVQGAIPAAADQVAGLAGAHAKKLAAAERVVASGMALTINAVLHRQNMDQLEDLIALAASLGATRLEIAHVQYYGWAVRNRGALIPSRDAVRSATEIVEIARARLRGMLVIDHVPPDHYAERPKACMAGWGRQFINVTPTGTVLPCHAAETISALSFDSVRDRSLGEIWTTSEAFERFRGTDWMPEPCGSCERREIDWGGCRCQALLITGDAANTDPACAFSPHHGEMRRLAAAADADPPPFAYRSFS
jgi:pyrroloquinoline quinone biosynthesis protein E